MSEPTQEFLRRDQVMDWLAGAGISRSQTRKLIEEKVIAGAPLPGRPAASAIASNGKKKHHGRLPGQLVHYYRKSQIKEKLNL